MSIIEEVFRNEKDNRKERTDADAMHQHHKEESNISKSKMESSELGLNKEIIASKKLL